jgi:hypothetical protein
MRSTKLLVLIPALAALALAGCKKESVEGPLAGCKPVSFSSYCTSDTECCSFGCIYGTCVPNPVDGGVCQTHGDCQAPMLCINQRCTGSVTCIPGGPCNGTRPCCTGVCTMGSCPLDHPPVAVAGPNPSSSVPFRIAIQLTNASYDPDTGTGDGLSYAWTVVSRPSGSTASFDPSSTFPAPRFTPDVTGTYTLRLTASNAGGSGVDDITFTAVNTPPEIVMPPDILGTTYQSRNVPLTFSATVSDADGGPITCAWAKKSPSAVTTAVQGPCGLDVCTCAGASGAAATANWPFTLNEDQSGTWELILTVSDGFNTAVSKSRFVNVQNDPPVANAGPKRYGNYALGSIPLNGTATDINGDVTNGNVGGPGFTWRWTVTARPGGSSIPIGYEVGTTPSVSFTPDAEGTFTLMLTADDHRGGPNGSSGTSTVDVQVDPYILPLGEVADAQYVDGSQKIVLVETDVGSAYQLKIADPATLDVSYVVTLAARPTGVSLNSTQTEATVGEVGGGWQRISGIQAIPTLAITVPAGQGAPSDLSDVVYASNCLYGMTGGGAVYYLDTAAPYAKSAICPNCTSGVNDPVGTRGAAGLAGTTNWYVWLFQTTTGRLGRYQVNTSNCNLSDPGTAFRTDSTVAGKEGFWSSADEQDLFTAWTTVYDARSTTLATRITTPLPLVPNHLSTTLVGSELVCAVAQYGTTALSTVSRTTVGGTFGQGANRAYPILGFNGDPKSNYGRFAFVKSGGGAYYAIVRANVGTDAAPVWKWGLVNLGP